MPEIIIVAGPNGAGKTTFANQYLAADREQFTFVNADEIARLLTSGDLLTEPELMSSVVNMRAGRLMLHHIDALVNANSDFMFETTLASLTYAQKIPVWQAKGYTVELVYLRLPNVESALERVQTRVKAGGHGIPENTVRQRFSKSLEYFKRHYQPIVDEWYIWDSVEGDFLPAEAWDDE